MKIFISSPAQTSQQERESLELLYRAVRAAKLRDFSFFRDVDNAKDLKDQKQLWARIYDELAACDGFLIDVTNSKDTATIVELGMAFALRKQIIAVKKAGFTHDAYIDGLANDIIEYEGEKDLASKLKAYDDQRVFGTTDTFVMLGLLVLLGGFIGYLLAQVYIPLGIIGAVLYWLILRKFIVQIRDFDRLIILIPFIFLWLAVFYWLKNDFLLPAIAWLVSFWIVALIILKKMKLSL